MSRTATSEYIGARRRAYAEAKPARRRRILDEVCETTGHSRKYANRLLTGSRKFREHKGSGRTYTQEAAALLKKVWLEAGCPCLPYFKAETGRWLDEYSSEVADVRPEDRMQLLRMSDRTMSRLLSGERRVKPGWSKANRRSGRGPRNDWSDFRNFFCPCKMLVAKEKRPDGKGFRCRYDSPKTPFQRLLDEGVLSPGQCRRLEAYRAGLSGMEFHRRVLKRLKKIRHMQERYNRAPTPGPGPDRIAPMKDR